MRIRPLISGSRMSRALALLATKGDMTHREYMSILGTVCDTKDEMHNLSSEIRARGFVERRVCVTPAALEKVTPQLKDRS